MRVGGGSLTTELNMLQFPITETGTPYFFTCAAKSSDSTWMAFTRRRARRIFQLRTNRFHLNWLFGFVWNCCIMGNGKRGTGNGAVRAGRPEKQLERSRSSLVPVEMTTSHFSDMRLPKSPFSNTTASWPRSRRPSASARTAKSAPRLFASVSLYMPILTTSTRPSWRGLPSAIPSIHGLHNAHCLVIRHCRAYWQAQHLAVYLLRYRI